MARGNNNSKPPKGADISSKVENEDKVFTEQVIKEIMIQKNVDRDEALKILEAHK